MNLQEISVTIAVIAMVTSICSPIITAIINNHHQSKMKRLEMLAARKLDIIENYLKSASNASYTHGVPDDFANCKATIFLYAPASMHAKISELNNAVENTSFSDETSLLLQEVASLLSKENNIR